MVDPEPSNDLFGQATLARRLAASPAVIRFARSPFEGPYWALSFQAGAHLAVPSRA
jgi:hypothetical protein